MYTIYLPSHYILTHFLNVLSLLLAFNNWFARPIFRPTQFLSAPYLVAGKISFQMGIF